MDMLATYYGIVVILLNACLLSILLYLYTKSYSKLQSIFTMGLIFFALVLLVKAISKTYLYVAVLFEISNPNLFYAYNVITETFEFFALVILLYLTTR